VRIGQAAKNTKQTVAALVSSRVHRLGSGYTRFAARYDQWDYRGFVKLTGGHTRNIRLHDADLPGSSTTTLWLGPSILAIFKNIAISGGVQAPLCQDASETLYGREHLRSPSTSAISNTPQYQRPLKNKRR
jgi:hypothetical protein